ncbi:MAG: ribokinase [Planctomycetota bacterium]
MPRIVVVGSANMDLVLRCPRIPRPGETLLGDSVTEAPGGKGANQAVAASRLGGDVTLIGRVGDDAFAGRLLDSLSGNGVRTDRVASTEGIASGVATISVADNGENAILVIPGANALVTPADVAAARESISAADTLLLQLETPQETIVAAIAVAREAGVRVILDPAPVPATVAAGLLDVDIICPNETEAEALLGRSVGATADERLAAAKALTQLGARTAIITLGAEGAVWTTRDGESGTVAAPKIDPVDTTAAGDAFAGALGLRLAEGADLPTALRFACAAGSAAATRLGAQPGMPTRAEVEALL